MAIQEELNLERIFENAAKNLERNRWLLEHGEKLIPLPPGTPPPPAAEGYRNIMAERTKRDMVRDLSPAIDEISKLPTMEEKARAWEKVDRLAEGAGLTREELLKSITARKEQIISPVVFSQPAVAEEKKSKFITQEPEKNTQPVSLQDREMLISRFITRMQQEMTLQPDHLEEPQEKQQEQKPEQDLEPEKD